MQFQLTQINQPIRTPTISVGVFFVRHMVIASVIIAPAFRYSPCLLALWVHTNRNGQGAAAAIGAENFIPWFVSPQNYLSVRRGWHGWQNCNILSGFLKIGLAGEQSGSGGRERESLRS
jgi:hypothetical protein